MNPLSIDSQTASSFGKPAEGLMPVAADTTNPTKSSFAQLFEQIHPLQKPGQALQAAQTPGHGHGALRQEFAALQGATGGEQALVAWSISPQLEVIKPDNADPDHDSMLAFAKSQGLSDEVLSWLFQPGGGARATTTTTEPVTINGIDVPADDLPGIAVVIKDAIGLSQGEPLTLPPAPNMAIATDTPLAPVTALAPASTIATDTPLAPVTALAPASAPSIDPAHTPVPSADPSSPLTTASAWTPTQATTVPAPVTATSTSSTQLPSSLNTDATQHGQTAQSGKPLVTGSLDANPSPTKTDAVAASVLSALSALTPGEAKTLSTKSGAGSGAAAASEAQALVLPIRVSTGPLLRSNISQQSQKPNLTAARQESQAAEILTLTIDLDVETVERMSREPAADTGTQTPSGHPSATNPQTGHTVQARMGLGLAGTSAAGAPAGDAVGANAEKAAELSERLGQAIGERMLLAMERGQWSVKLMLKPAHLGHVEVEMRMRNGELDTSFLASQAATRDLLQAGLGQLRASLTGAGMDVASMSVTDYQDRSSGGESTPKQARASASAQRIEAGAESTDTSPQAGIRRSSHDGLDVLV